MSKQASKTTGPARTIWWVLGGAFVLVGVMVGEHLVSGLPLSPVQLTFSALLGSLAGYLLGRSDLRWRNLNLRLEDSERRFQKLCQDTPAMLHSLDSKGRILYVSQTWLDRLGYQRDQVVGNNFFDFVAGDNLDEVKSTHLETLRKQGEISEVHYRLRHANGSEIEVAITETAQSNQNGELIESLAVTSDLSTQRAAEERIERLAYFDTLTDLPNRALLNDRMLQAIAQARRDECQFGVFFFDLDRFKMINDTQGHAVGDLVLRSVAQRLKQFIREGDTLARLGGDEFVIIQADPNHEPSFTIMARRILETLNEPFRVGEREFYTTASLGVAVYPVDGNEPQALLKSADTAMYVAKSQGRNNFQFFSGEMNASALAKSNLENHLRTALLNKELQQHYQAQVDLATGRITGVEALLRWQDEYGNPVNPSEAIAVAEESGLIYPLGEWTLSTACAQAKAWQDAGLPPMRISVNLSGHHIRQSNFIDLIEETLEQTGLGADCLEIELAETSVMSQVDDIIMALTDLQVRGINLTIDDFGSGYSSLLYLMHFPIHRIKIAKEFIGEIGQQQDYTAVTEAIIAMARSLGLSVSAVGIESEQQMQFLQKHGCIEGQGNFFSRVMPADEMSRYLHSQNSPTDAGNGIEITPTEESREIH